MRIHKISQNLFSALKGFSDKLANERPLTGGGRYKCLQVDWLSLIDGSWDNALKGPLREVEPRDLVLSISWPHRLTCVVGR